MKYTVRVIPTEKGWIGVKKAWHWKKLFFINHSNYYLPHFSARLIISGKPKGKREFKKKGNRIGHFLDDIKFKKANALVLSIELKNLINQSK